MAKHRPSLLLAIVMAVIFFVVAMVFSALAAPGKHPFLAPTGNTSDAFANEITPSGWTFIIWTVIYIFLALVCVYALSGLFRKNAYGYVYCSPALLPHGFFATWCLNLGLNVGWLFLWDRRLMAGALVFLILVAVTNYVMIFYSCHSLHVYGAWLYKYHKVDLWLHRALVQNGIAIYATWTTVASLVNLSIVLVKDAKMAPEDAVTLSFSLLTAVLLVWFVLENTVLDRYLRHVLSIYPVVIWALTGVFTKNYDAVKPSRNNVFTVALLGISCALLALRILLVIWKNIKKPLLEDVLPEEMSPMEIAMRQKKIFK